MQYQVALFISNLLKTYLNFMTLFKILICTYIYTLYISGAKQVIFKTF